MVPVKERPKPTLGSFAALPQAVLPAVIVVLHLRINTRVVPYTRTSMTQRRALDQLDLPSYVRAHLNRDS